MLSVGGLFSGIGGWELGLERAGMRTLWHCEADPFARSILEHHWPGIPCYDDVRDLRGAEIEPVDVLCGGFPCQDISVAGAGAGIAGAKSGLWGEYARLVDELRPRYVCVENVAALLGRGLERVLGDLAALGYDAEWDCIPAAAVGAHHLRDRIWLVAYPGGSRRRQDARSAHGDEAAHEGRPAPDDHVADGDGQGRRARPVADTEGERCGQGRAWGSARASEWPAELSYRPWDAAHAHGLAPFGPPVAWRERGPWRAEPDVGRVAHGIPARMDRLRCLGNALVPQIAELIGRRIIEHEESRMTSDADAFANFEKPQEGA